MNLLSFFMIVGSYRVRIGSNTDAANLGRLHVDYAQARDDLYECKRDAREKRGKLLKK